MARTFLNIVAVCIVTLAVGLIVVGVVSFAQLIVLTRKPVGTQAVLVCLTAVAVAVLATVFPARQAARMYPVEAIRHE